jgi:hypothetical protein
MVCSPKNEGCLDQYLWSVYAVRLRKEDEETEERDDEPPVVTEPEPHE